MGKLTALSIGKAKEKGLYPDGDNLYLQVSKTGTKSWLFRFMMHKKSREMGLGKYPDLTLAAAREKASDCRKLLSAGIDPIAARKNAQEKAKLETGRNMTFEQCATAYIKAHEVAWKNEKHRWQWDNTLTRFVYPTFGNRPIQEIDIPLVLKALEPIWKEKTETATRVRSRIEAILNWATVHGYREGDNPALWKGRLEKLLPSPAKIRQVQHQPALPYKEIGPFMEKLSSQVGFAAKALTLLILTATRTSEILNAEWQEFDLKEKVWVIPANRIKMGKEHRVPLSTAAINVLEELKELKMGSFLFPGQKAGKPLSNLAMLMLLRRMEYDNITVHGFRSTFRDWVAEQTDYSSDVAETALAHAVGNRVEAAYRRSDFLEKRRQLMEDWAEYICP